MPAKQRDRAHAASEVVMQDEVEVPGRTRRQLLATLGTLGIGSAVFQRALADEAARATKLTREQIASAEWVAGISLRDDERDSLLGALEKTRQDCETIRAVSLEYETLPAFRFDPESADLADRASYQQPRPWLRESPGQSRDDSGEQLSFVSIRELGRRLRAGEVSSVDLTEHCLRRLVEADETLNCVVTLTRDLALRQAEQADRELAEGRDRGPLHGIPWGAKDLIAVSGYPTTWGAPQFRNQLLRDTATVARRLESAGAVLVAKLSLGALAMGDQWYLGQTKNPWNTSQGSSGSSAGSASAVAAGLVPFALGSETLGSIISPCRRCGVAGLRPTFGRVPRTGCMALSWTMDKIGPIARSADDLGLVLNAIHGADERDPTAVDRWFKWPMDVDLTALRIGRVANAATGPADEAALSTLQSLGVTLVDVELPRDIPEWSLAAMLDVEAACVFEPLTRSGDTDGLNAWAGIFQRSHFVSAVDFLHASRARMLLMTQMVDVFRQVDLYVGGNDLGITNLTGHPMLALPVLMQGDATPQPRPVCCTLTGGLYDEATLLAVASKIETAVDVLTHQPELAAPK